MPTISYNMEPLNMLPPLIPLSNGINNYRNNAQTSNEHSSQLKVPENTQSTPEKELNDTVEKSVNAIAETNGLISNHHETEKTEINSIKATLIPKDNGQHKDNDILEELPKLIPIKSARQDIPERNEMPPLIPITKHNNRLCMAQLIERKLQSELEEYDYIETENPLGVQENGTEEDDLNTVPVIEEVITEEIEGENVNDRKQLIGTLVKGVRKSARPTKPPWLLKASEKDSDDKSETCTNESGDLKEPIAPKENEMREKLFNQLKQLKVKKTEPLVSTHVPTVNLNLRYEKRLIKTDPLNADENTNEADVSNEIVKPNKEIYAHSSAAVKTLCSASSISEDAHTSAELEVEPHSSAELEEEPHSSAELVEEPHSSAEVEEEPHSSGKQGNSTSSLGLQIVAVVGGVDIDDCEKLMTVDNIPNGFHKSVIKKPDATEVEHQEHFDTPNANEVIINKHLDLPTIKLTKTYDYKKIKGWCNKRLITVDQIGESKNHTDNLDDPEPSCSYNVHSNEENSVSLAQSENVFASKGLDGFLAEKDLNISYNVPNLKSTNHNINLLDDCMLVDVEQERKNESQRKSIENEDSNSSSSLKDYGKTNDYKPRTLAEKRKMLSDEKEKSHSKRFKIHDTRRSRSKRSSDDDEFLQIQDIKTEIHQTMPILEPPVLIAEPQQQQPQDDDDDDDNLLVPIDQLERFLPEDNEVDKRPDVIFLTEEESKPKNCVISKIRFRGTCHLHPVAIPSRVPIKRVFYHKVSDVRRKWRYEYVVKYKRPFRTKPPIMKKAPVIDYKPGPLCKKKNLQVNANQVWRTVVVDLPRISLEVVPKICAPVHPAVRPFVEFHNFDITETRADFALSALRGTNNTQAFNFPVYYAHGQEKLLCRKLNKPLNEDLPVPRVVTKYEPETEEQVNEAIGSVIDGMLNYVELKELDETKHDYDKDVPESLNNESADVAKGCDSPKLKRLDKVGLALRVLGVRIVDLSQQEKVSSGDSCTQEQCKFGCVCQSIHAQYPPLSHCGEAQCIFGCKCGFENAARNNSKEIEEKEWNEHAIKRFNKEATKHITAREERDFMQTAIRSSDNKIILGKVRESKRARKYNFKRYAGFHFSFTTDDTGMFKESSKAIIQNDPKLRSCHVDLVRCDFSDVIPFCMVHNLYECHCKGTATFSESDQMIMLAAKKAQKTVEAITNASTTVDNDPPPPKLQREVAPPAAPAKDMSYFNNKANVSARIRGTGEYYCLRNKTNRYKTSMARKLKYDKTVDMEIVTRWIILPSDIRAAQHNNNKRKQALTPKDDIPENVEIIKVTDTDVGEDDESSGASEDVPSTYKIEPPKSSPCIISIPSDNLKAVHTLGEISSQLQSNGTLYSPTTSINERFSAMLNAKSKTLANFRLLLWPVLMKLYLRGDINIWINNHNVKYRFIVTDVTVQMKDGYENIRMFEGMRNIAINVDFIRWIVTRTLPDDKDGSNILVIIKLLDTCWEICGICARNSSNSEISAGPPLSKRPKIEKERPANNPVNVNKKILIVEKSPRGNTPRIVGEYKNGETSNVRALKDQFEVKKEVVQRVDDKYYKTSQQVSFAHGTFSVKSLVLSNPQDKAVGERAMIAALPYITHDYRWRVLKVNSNFKILSFAKTNFSIKCSDILTVMKVAVKSNKTIVVNMDGLEKSHKHPAFAIFIPATHQDRIFIGPYQRDEEHGLETLRFLNNKLINTEEFNKMRGILNVACTGLWYDQYGRTSVNTITETQSSVIDLTSAEEMKDVVKPIGLVITPVEQCVKLKAAQLKSRSVLKPLPPANLTPIGDIPEDHTATVNFPLAAISIPKLSPLVKSFKNVADDKHVKNSSALETQSSNNLKHILQSSADKKYNLHIPEVTKVDKTPPDNILTDYVDIVHLENSPNQIEEMFFSKLRDLITQIGVILPANATPVCFRLNFGNGIIIAYRIKKRINIFWPGDRNRVIQFTDFDHAVKWLKCELQRVFISIPTTFKIIVSPVGPAHYREYMNRSVISENYFKEICIIGEFGIMRFSEARPYLLCSVAEACDKLAMSLKSEKFKKAIYQIINCNDMKPSQLLSKVNSSLSRNFKSADNSPENPPTDKYEKKFVFTKKFKKAWPNSSSVSSETTSTLQSSTTEVICIDSDGEEGMYQMKVNSNAIGKKMIHKKIVLSDDEISLKSLLKSNQEKQFKNVTIMPPIGSEHLPCQTDENVVHVNFKDMSLKDIKAVLSFYGNKGLTPKDLINKSDKVSPAEATTNCR